MKSFLTIFIVVCLMPLLGTGTQAAIQNKGDVDQLIQPTAMPGMVYVSDFAIDVAEVKEDGGILGQRGLLRGGILQRRGPLEREQDPAALAANLVRQLAASIVEGLNSRNVSAVRIPKDQSVPDKGWLVRGQFLQVDEGNRLRRAVIGFGEGATDMQIQVEVCNLGSHPDTPFLAFGTQTGSGKKPGAVVTMNPYVAAAKFVLSKNATEEDVHHAGAEIAAEIVKYMKERGLMGPNQ